eukprot:1162003-Pelagomonas_calceolata.AAC.7
MGSFLKPPSSSRKQSQSKLLIEQQHADGSANAAFPDVCRGLHYCTNEQCLLLDFMRFLTVATASGDYVSCTPPHAAAVQLPCCYTSAATCCSLYLQLYFTNKKFQGKLKTTDPAGIRGKPKNKY